MSTLRVFLLKFNALNLLFSLDYKLRLYTFSSSLFFSNLDVLFVISMDWNSLMKWILARNSVFQLIVTRLAYRTLMKLYVCFAIEINRNIYASVSRIRKYYIEIVRLVRLKIKKYRYRQSFFSNYK